MSGDWAFDDFDDFPFFACSLRRIARLYFDMCWHCLFGMDYVPAGQRMGSMSELNVLIEQMVSDIGAQAYQLDDLRLRMFLNWLVAHSGWVKVATGNVLDMDIAVLRGIDMQEQFKLALKTWLESLTAEGLLWEYRTITVEIGWWRDLDPFRLKMITKTEME
jgi:hypothetical protein